jgi:GAF domain-containing protein
MTRLAVFCDAPQRRSLERSAGRGLAFTFFDARGPVPPDLGAAEAVLVEVGPGATPARLVAMRKAAGRRALGGLLVRPDAARLARARRLGFDFVVEAWRPGDPAAAAILTHLRASRGSRAGALGRDVGLALRRTAKRLAILTDIVKTANSILEPRKVIELIMGKIQQLIPSEAWSMLMVDEEKQELAFELALGAKGKDVSSYRVKIGEGVAGWVAQTGKPAIVNDAARDSRFTRKFDTKTQFETRSILCAPLISRGRTIGVVEIINRVGGRFTQTDLDILLTLVEPCAIAIENAMLFQRTEQLTITDDLTKLFNSGPRRVQGDQRPVRAPRGLGDAGRGGQHPGRGGARVRHPGPLRR